MQPLRTRITLQDLANAANVHRSTVSRALRGDPRISTAMRKQIEALARRLNYRPDPRVSELMQLLRVPEENQVTESLAVLHDFAVRETERLETVERYLQWMKPVAAKHGFGVESFSPAGRGGGWSALARVLLTRGVRGVCVMPFYRTDIRSWKIPWEKFAVVSIGSTPAKPAFHRIDTDDFGSMQLILEGVERAKFKRVGLLVEERFNEHTRHTLLGAYLAWQHRLAPGIERIPVFGYDRDSLAYDELDAWVARWKPDVVIPCCVQRTIADWLEAKPFEWVRFGMEGQGMGLERSAACEMVETATELLIGKVLTHQRGLPALERITLVGSRWVDRRKRKRP